MHGLSEVSRREFLTGPFRSRNAALAVAGALVWTHVLDGAYHLTLRSTRSVAEHLEEGDHHAMQSAV